LLLYRAMFAEHGVCMPDGGVSPAAPFLTPQQWTDLGAGPIVVAEPVTCLDDLFFVSAEIPQITD
jgi:hypothetical protein